MWISIVITDISEITKTWQTHRQIYLRICFWILIRYLSNSKSEQMVRRQCCLITAPSRANNSASIFAQLTKNVWVIDDILEKNDPFWGKLSFIGVSDHFLGINHQCGFYSNYVLHATSFILLFSLRHRHKKWLFAHNAAQHDNYEGNHLEQIIFLIQIFRNSFSDDVSHGKNPCGCDLCFTDHFYPKSNLDWFYIVFASFKGQISTVNISSHLS